MFHELRKSEFVKQLTVLFTGTFFAQLIPFITLPILQKYFYSPTEFGIFALFVALGDLVGRAAMLKLDFGIVTRKRVKDAINLAAGAFRIGLWVTALTILFVVLFRSDLSDYFGQSGTHMIVYLLPVYVFLVFINDLATGWFNRNKQFTILSVGKVLQSGSAETLKFAGSVTGLSFLGLVAGRLGGMIVTMVYFAFHFWKKDASGLRLINKRRQRELIKENRNFIFYSTPSVFIGNFIQWVYLNLFLFYFNRDLVGILSVSTLYLSAGFGLLATSFSQVFYRKIAEIHEKQELLRVYVRGVRYLSVFSVAIIAIVYLIPETWIVQLLGQQWEEMMGIMKIVVWWLGAWFVASSLSFIYIRLEKQRTMLIFDVVHLVTIALGIPIGFWLTQTFSGALWGFVIAQVIYYLLVIGLAIRFIRNANTL